MEKIYNIGSLILIVFCIVLSGYSFYSYLGNPWLLAPPNYIILGFTVIAFVFGIMGLKDKRSWRSKLRSWLTLILSLVMAILLSFAILFGLFFGSLGVNEHIKTVESPDENYTIDFYYWDQGATGTFGIRGELDGPLWTKKRIYLERRMENIDLEWESDNVISINNHLLNLEKGDTYGY